MRRILAWILAIAPLTAEADTAGDFDYYVMSLSWSPNWCALEGDARGSDQCAAHHDHGWILHGLWPQYERGYPRHCQTAQRPPSRSMTAGMADIMGTSGLAWHQWKKHGTCTGLSAADYYDLSRDAYDAISRPQILRQLSEPVDIAPGLIEEVFVQANPHLAPDGITITCRAGHIQEARICLSKDLKPRRCGTDVIRDCTDKNARFAPIR